MVLLLHQFARLAHDHVAIVVLLAYDAPGLFGIACYHSGVHELGVATLLEPEFHHVGLHALCVAEEILCAHARTVAAEVVGVAVLVGKAAEVRSQWAVLQLHWPLCWQHWPC